MGSNNLYYNPEKELLRVVAELNEKNMSYEFNTFMVWEHRITGDMYFAMDTGCSCPTPFENYKTIDQLTKVREIDQIYTALISWASGMSREDRPMTDEFMRAVRRSWAVTHGHPL
jgi:hypothetical protein